MQTTQTNRPAQTETQQQQQQRRPGPTPLPLAELQRVAGGLPKGGWGSNLDAYLPTGGW